MIWDVAAGIIIGGGILGFLWLATVLLFCGSGVGGAFDRPAQVTGLLAMVFGLGLSAWVVFFKANL